MTGTLLTPTKNLVALADQEATSSAALLVLANQTGLPILPLAEPAQDYCHFVLFFQDSRLSLQSTDDGAAGAV